MRRRVFERESRKINLTLVNIAAGPNTHITFILGVEMG